MFALFVCRNALIHRRGSFTHSASNGLRGVFFGSGPGKVLNFDALTLADDVGLSVFNDALHDAGPLSLVWLRSSAGCR